MSRVLNVGLLLLFVLLCIGCEVLPLAPEEPDTNHYRVEFTYMDRTQVVTEDTSPVWDLGRHNAKAGEDRVVLITRHTSADEVDADGILVAGQHRELSVERLWVTLPAEARWGKWLSAAELDSDFLIGYDVDQLDGNGFLKQSYLVKGYLNPLEEAEGELIVVFDLEVRPGRPFNGSRWAVQGKHTIPKVERPESDGAAGVPSRE